MVFLGWLIGYVLFLFGSTFFLYKEQNYVSIKDFAVLIGVSIFWWIAIFFVIGYWLDNVGDDIIMFGKKK